MTTRSSDPDRTDRTDRTDRVVLGVDGSETTRGALGYAVAEARRHGIGLELVHVLPDVVSISTMAPIPPQELAETATEILGRAEAGVAALDPDLEPSSTLRRGPRPVELVRAAEGARELVVGRDARPLVERLLRGDTATGVAARARVPVVVVPEDWEPPTESEPAPEHRVVAGLKRPEHAESLLADAFAVARERAATLVVLHAWMLPSAYDEMIQSRTEQWTHSSVAAMEELLRQWRADHPDVKLEVRVVHDHPAHALIRASRDADLLVVGRRSTRGVPAAWHLGGTARDVLRGAHVPVRVAPPLPRG